MRAADVKRGEHYIAKVGERLTVVKLLGERGGAYGAGSYDVLNVATGRKTTFRSSQKFRRAASEAEVEKATARAKSPRIRGARSNPPREALERAVARGVAKHGAVVELPAIDREMFGLSGEDLLVLVLQGGVDGGRAQAELDRRRLKRESKRVAS